VAVKYGLQSFFGVLG